MSFILFSSSSEWNFAMNSFALSPRITFINIGIFFIVTFLFIPSASAIYAQGFTEIYAGSLIGVSHSSIVWGDYDNDGDLDILIMGVDNSNLSISKIYQNTGSGFIEVFAGTLPGVQQGSVSWGDYDNDGDLDILIMGYNSVSGYISKIYQNTGSGFTEVFAGSLTGVCLGNGAWGDYDNDGDLDILLTGTNEVGPISKIYQNSGSGFSEVFAGSLTPVYYSPSSWGDYDNDGDLDILLTGQSGSGPISKIYQNTGTGFTEVFAGSLLGVTGWNNSAAWGDYDNDGDLDIVLSGYNGGPNTKIYQNTGSGFTEVFTGNLIGLYSTSVAWGDYDNDGDLDLLLTGNSTAGSTPNSKVYQNTGGGFSEVFPGSLTAVTAGMAIWGDYDHDGDLDILMTGHTGVVRSSKIYRNNGTTFNTTPNAPSGLTSTQTGTGVVLQWNRASDTQTPSAGLMYNLRIGTSSNGINTLSPMSNVSNGFRRVVQIGNANQDTAWTIKNLPTGTYYWSVQAVDNGFAGGAFSVEQSFTTNSPPVARDTSISLNEDTVKSFALPASDPDNTPLTYTILSGPFHGDLSGLVPNVTYAPSANFYGSDSLVFRVSDGTVADTAKVRITINSVNDAFFLTINSLHGNVTTNPVQGNYDYGQDVILTASPDEKFGFTGWSGDTTDVSNPITVTMTGNKTVTANFDTLAPFVQKYRTATYEDWATSSDAKGKRVSIKRKADKVFFKFTIIADSARPLKMDFGMTVNATITRGTTKLDTVYRVSNGKKLIDSLLTVVVGETLQVDGIGAKGSKVKVKYQWGKKKAVTMKADSLYKVNKTGLPMPNLVNVGEELFSKGFGNPAPYFPTGLTIGIPVGKKKPNTVFHKKFADVQKSLVKKGKSGLFFHSDTLAVRCLDSLDGKKKKFMVSQQKSLSSDKQNNALFAEALTLKLNIAASAMQKFPVGIEELTFSNPDDPTNSFNGEMVSTISTYSDSMLSCLTLTSKPTATLSELYSALRNINVAFADSPYTIDTLSFGSKTQLTGLKLLFDVPYLSPADGISPKMILTADETVGNTPEEFALYQNYPNPFNPSTTLSFVIANTSLVTLKIFNMLGQEIATLVQNEEMEGGIHEVTFDATNFSSGVYFYRINVESVDEDGLTKSFTDVKRMLLIK